ncbi:uncharacterized protein LOC121249356 [Juglans microcarpa x Juglans regia]|uniref:uncharacterized protein LOC121249356 n=1 Tax=Juglans microcarpa x Juglans regia TaxID=2249226 RepID=UPI001B7F30C6|nr:uncharacterized protein LOC121249356 [Juglans microcarpa x Juglans regia]
MSRFRSKLNHGISALADDTKSSSVYELCRTILVTDLLHAENFSTWSGLLQRALRTKNKISFLNGTLSQPSNPTEPLFDLWDRCNDIVVSWIQISISLPLHSSVAFVDNAHDIWTELQERFSPQNGPQIYELKKPLANLSQEDDTTNGYYGKLKSLWDELSIHDPLPVCSCGSTKTLSDRYQRDCVIQFLMGLNDSYSNVRDHIMLLDPLPLVTKVFSYIQQQERHQMVTSSTPHPDSIALATPWNIASCKLHGYPPGHKMHKPRRNVVSFDSPVSGNQTDSNSFLTKDQYKDLIALLHSKDSNCSPSVNHLQTVISTHPHSSSTAGPFSLDNDWEG